MTPIVLAVLAVLAIVYVAGFLFTSDRLPRDASVAGVDIGGMSPDDAEQKLDRELAPLAEEPLVLRVDGQQVELDPAQLGLALDTEATVARAGGGRSLNPVRMFSVLTGGREVEPVIDVDEQQLTEQLETVADKVDTDVKAGSISFRKGEPVAAYPKPGLRVDIAATAERLREALLSQPRTVDAVTETLEPEVTKAEIDQAVEGPASTAVSGPVVLRTDGESIEVQPADFASALSMEVVDDALELKLDRKELSERLREPLAELGSPAKDATVQLRDGRPRVVPGKPGLKVEAPKLPERFLDALQETGKDRAVAVKTVRAKPDFTTADAKKLGIKEVVSSFSTEFEYGFNGYRNTNLGRAAEKINGTVLRPGETFSLNGVVGERTRANGFTEGYIINQGVLVKDLGGGVSQVATTTYNAAFFAGMTDVEHHPHSFYISTYPIGREATVAWGSKDLRFRNDTPYGVLVRAWIDPATTYSTGTMHVQIWSTKYWDIEATHSAPYNYTSPDVRNESGPNCVDQAGRQGFDVDVTRIFNRNGKQVKDEHWHVTYIAGDAVNCS